MIKVTDKELYDFIMSQADDRPVDMNQNFADEGCGCVMVQYGWENGWEFDGCAYDSWSVENQSSGSPVEKIIAKLGTGKSIFDKFSNSFLDGPVTFKDLKDSWKTPVN